MVNADRTVRRLTFAAKKLLGREVMTMARDDWRALVTADGQPTLLNEAPGPAAGVMDQAMFVAAAASGVCNPEPGFDIVRYDRNDEPNIYNVDHYQVLEKLELHPEYSRICSLASVQPSEDLAACLANTVFIVKNEPGDTPDHWTTELPHRINIARHKMPIDDSD